MASLHPINQEPPVKREEVFTREDRELSAKRHHRQVINYTTQKDKRCQGQASHTTRDKRLPIRSDEEYSEEDSDVDRPRRRSRRHMTMLRR